jgi:hypothetical protein
LPRFLLWPSNDFEILDPPDIQPGYLSDFAIVPGRLRGSGVVLDAVIDFGTDQFDVAVLDIIFFKEREAVVGSHIVVTDSSIVRESEAVDVKRL